MGLYLSCDAWDLDPMRRDPDGVWRLARMIPTSRVRFMYRVDGSFRTASDEVRRCESPHLSQSLWVCI